MPLHRSLVAFLPLYFLPAAFLVSAAVPGAVSAQISVGSTKQISVSTTGTAPSGTSGTPRVASNGKFVVFNSNASNLVSNDSNQQTDVFIRDLTTNVITRASVNDLGIEGDGPSQEQSISPVSPEGLYAVSFSSDAQNFVLLDNIGATRNIYLRLPTLNKTSIISVSTSGSNPDGDSSAPSVVLLRDPFRALVAFASEATNLVDVDTNRAADIFLATVQLQADGSIANLDTSIQIVKLTPSAGSVTANGESSRPVLSGDGRFVFFASEATNLVSDTTTSGKQIFRYTVENGQIDLVSKSTAGAAADADCDFPATSFSGRFLSYTSAATNLVDGGTPGKSSIIYHDLMKNTVIRANTDSLGTASNGDAGTSSVSSNGRFVTFSDNGTNLASGDTNNRINVYVKDTDSGAAARLSNGVAENVDGNSDFPTVAGESYNSLDYSVFYRSLATNLTPDAAVQGGGDIFETDASLSPPQLRKGSVIEVPADVVINGRRPKITAQRFIFPVTTRAPSSGKRVTYEFRVQGTGNRRKVKLNLTSKRNTITTAKLKPGIYNTRYRAIATNGAKVVSKSGFSPRQSFEIP